MERGRTPRVLTADLAIVGGGLAGVCAALAAARNGAKVVLVQDRPVLGGNASSEIRMHIVGADCHGKRPGARETGLIEELRIENAMRNAQRSFSQWDLLLYEKVILEPNITLLLNATCVGCSVEEDGPRRTIRSMRVRRDATEEAFEIGARFFADCSGDGRLGFEAGADFRMGREGRDEYGESLAAEKADAKTLGSSILITARKHEMPQPFLTPSWVRTFRKEDLKHRPVDDLGYGFWWAEWGGELDGIGDGDRIRHELLRISLGVWSHVKNSGDYPQAANWALDWVGAIPGKRESRRFLGPHVLTQGDVESGRVFPDQVAYGGWWLDLHPPGGVDAVDEEPCTQTHVPHLYSIPLRCLYSRNVANLFFAGRNASATHVAFASTRVMATCALMGQAVGTAAAVLLSRGGGPGIAEAATPEAVGAVQQALLRDDAFLLGVANADPGDLARDAAVRASATHPGTRPEAVVRGATRRIEAAWGPWAQPEASHWESEGLPAWIELEWPSAREIAEVHLTFCSGLERMLTLTPSDYLTSRMAQGPQPEIVRDYNVTLDGRTVLEVRGNFQRKRRHLLDRAPGGSRLRIEFLATHGLPAARVFEVRAYGPKTA